MIYVARMRGMPDFTVVDTTIEGAAVLMAAGYQHLTGGVGAVVVDYALADKLAAAGQSPSLSTSGPIRPYRSTSAEQAKRWCPARLIPHTSSK